MNGTTTDGGAPSFWIWSSDPDEGQYYQETLGELADLLSGRLSRWKAILMLRVLRLRLEGVRFRRRLPPIGLLDQRVKGHFGGSRSSGNTARMCQNVYRSGRLSEVGVQLGCESMIANREHIDIDWYGVEPLPHWWNATFTGLQAEREAARVHLHHLEASFGLGPSGPDPSSWTWPPGTHGETWSEKLLSSKAPKILSGFSELVLQWHEGATVGDFECFFDGAKFWYSTPEPGALGTY